MAGEGARGRVWGRATFLKADRESEMEHIAYREISTECSLMNAPLYPCHNGEKKAVMFFFFCFVVFSFPCPCAGVFPGNKGCERVSDHVWKGRCINSCEGNTLFSCVTWVTDNVTDPHMTHADLITHLTPVPPVWSSDTPVTNIWSCWSSHGFYRIGQNCCLPVPNSKN